MKRGQSLNDFELNQNPVLINQPYCRTNIKKKLSKRTENEVSNLYAVTKPPSYLRGKRETFIKFSMISLLFTATRTTIQRLKRPA